ncbi:MAG: protease modulator HflC [Lachnospiraceae bacterium]|nr:protease modulator HflC [Lachnospiraceae bacterium]
MKSKITGILIGLIVFILLIIGCSSLYTVDYKTQALVMEFGKISHVETNPGLHVKVPFVQSVQAIYIGDRVYDIPASDVITKDKKTMIADDYVIWRVTDPVKYYQTLSGIAARAEERIDAAVFNATKNTISSMIQDEVIASRGEQLTNIITTESNSDISGYGIEIITAKIKALDLPDDNKSAVYERMISERQNIAAGYTAKGNADAQLIKNQTDKTVSIKLAEANKLAEQLVAEGEAEYMRILSDAYNSEDKADFYNYLRSLDTLKASLSGRNKTIILDKNSELVRILYGAQ